MPTKSVAAAIAVSLASTLVAAAVHAADTAGAWNDGPFELRLRGVYLDPANHSDAFTLPCATGTTCGPVGSNQVKLGSKLYGELGGEWYFLPNLSAELALGLPRSTDVSVAGTGVGGFKLMPDTLTLKYGFLPQDAFRPYLGLGAHYTSLSSRALAVPAGAAYAASALQIDSDKAGWVAQAGFDYQIARQWFFNADLRYLGNLKPQLGTPTATLGAVKINPLLLSVGIGYRFGGSAVAPPVVAAAPLPAPKPAAAPPPPPPPPVAAPPPAKPLDSDGDGVPDELDQCPGTPHGTRVDQFGCPCDVTQQVHFATDSAVLTDEDKRSLDQLIPQLRRMHFSNGQIAGYTDATGAKMHNQKLSERRAQSVADYLKSQGIGTGAVTVAGFGAADPVADNATREGRALNRRVVLRRTDCQGSPQAAH